MFDNDEWLNQVDEPVLEPELEIVDAHHHLWKDPAMAYGSAHFASDLNSGHNIIQTIFMECKTAYRETGPEHLKPVGETEFVASMASRPEIQNRIAGLVAHADLTNEFLDEVLDAHEEAGGGLFKGIRHSGAFDPNPDQLLIPGRAPKDLFEQDQFRQGVEQLGLRGLPFDTWIFHHQIEAFCNLANAVPGTTMVLDHVGMPIGVGTYAVQKSQIFQKWKHDIRELSQCQNVRVKLGGLAMPDMGFGWDLRDKPANTRDFVAAFAPWYDHVVDCFGSERCMFESNFPVDRLSMSYKTLWNGFKQLSSNYSHKDRKNLFSAVSRNVYRLPAQSNAD